MHIDPVDIEVLNPIGQGSSGIVYAAKHIPSATTLALKGVNPYVADRRTQLTNDILAL